MCDLLKKKAQKTRQRHATQQHKTPVSNGNPKEKKERKSRAKRSTSQTTKTMKQQSNERATLSAEVSAFHGPLAFSSSAAISALATLAGAAAAVAYERTWRARTRAANILEGEKMAAATNVPKRRFHPRRNFIIIKTWGHMRANFRNSFHE